MARNHVWRYTLRLFHTFALSGKSLKIYAKREPTNHCERRALTAAPLGETGESCLVVRKLGNGENSEPAKKTTQNGIQKHQKSVKMGANIDAKSMKS